MGTITTRINIVKPLELDEDTEAQVEHLFIKQHELVMAILPTGTMYSGYNNLDSDGFFISREYKFRHPIFSDGSSVQLILNRATCLEDGGVKHYSVVSGIDYFDQNNVKIY